jgi:iron only hydrogenase large subunit-like protein
VLLLLQAASIAIEADGSYVSVADNGARTKMAKVGITLQDCLACSGCVTSAESILIEMQTHTELYKVLDKNASQVIGLRFDNRCVWPHLRWQPDPSLRSLVVVSVSPQTCASVAAKYALPLEQVCFFFFFFFFLFKKKRKKKLIQW